ncbi:MAG: hypothetical protein CVT85_08625 [Alphaproteobacteria bacterium HGW-Alphaproteobacteria-7]|nr:MAG: hypothetical protein CVT85_08625 [Alphaproteobacteria bacterium HGW-Alphaproteobacteria-7]
MCRYFQPIRRRNGPFWSNPAGTPEWLPSRPDIRLERQPAFPARISVRYVRHSGASKVGLIGPDPSLPAKSADRLT